LTRLIESEDGTFHRSDRDGDQSDRAGEQSDRHGDRTDREGDRSDHHGDQGDRDGDQTPDKVFRPKPGHQYARNYPDPLTGEPLQIYPSKSPSEFDSMDDFWKFKDAIIRWNSGLPPLRQMPDEDQRAPFVPVAKAPKPASRFKPTKSRHVGLRLTETDYAMLCELARAHGVRPGTMARMLVIRAVRAAADESD
jgi:hypothetical protein